MAEGTGSGLWLWERQGRAGGCREQDGRRWVGWGQSKGSGSRACTPRHHSRAQRRGDRDRDRRGFAHVGLSPFLHNGVRWKETGPRV